MKKHVLSILILLCAYPVLAQNIRTFNTAYYAGNDWWYWTIYLGADRNILSSIDHVEYGLHKSFKPQSVSATMGNDPAKPFALTLKGWGTFDVKVNIVFKDKHTKQLIHPLVFKETPRTGASLVTLKNDATMLKKDWYKWTVYVNNAPISTLKSISCVEYTLDATFKDPVREVTAIGSNPKKAFALTLTGWGEFNIKTKVHFIDGTVQSLPPYHLNLH